MAPKNKAMWNPEPYSKTYTRSKTTMAHASARRKVLEREDKAKEVETLEVEEASSGNKDDENSDNGGSSSDESSENEEVEVEEDSSRGNKIDENSDNGGSSSSSSSEESHEIDEASRRGKSRGSRGGRGGRRNIVSEDDSGSKNDENGENEEIQEVEYTSRGRGGRRGRGRGRSRDIERCGVDEMHGPFPGGPTNTSVLQNYSNHVARDVWDGIERGVLKVHMHITKFREWNINKENIKFRNALEKTCFWNLIEHHRRYTNIPLVSSFVERWYSDTNTFHFNFGEMAITLDDVSQILGLPIIGKAAVASSKIGKGEASVLLENCLGISTTSINEELSNPKRTENHVSHDWLKKNLMYKIKDTSTDEEVRCVVRGYLLYLFGCLLFVDKTGVQVSVAYLEMLKDYEKVNDYAWGAAILAHLYRMLSDASRANVAQMAGFVTLLEVWIYEHFPMFCPPPNMSYLEETPRVRRWSDYSSAYPDQMGTLRWFRECIDKLAPIHVYWDPYSIVRQVRPLHEISFFHGELGVLDITEAYHADRVLRQFSHVQLIPSEPLPKTKHRRTEGHYEVASRLFNMWPSHLLSSELRGSRVLSPWDCEKGYLTWFYTISHPVMTKPERFSKLHMPLPYDCKCQEKEIFANDES